MMRPMDGYEALAVASAQSPRAPGDFNAPDGNITSMPELAATELSPRLVGRGAALLGITPKFQESNADS